MRIGVNATCINDRPSGARQRFIGLFSHLVRLMPDSEFVFFEPEDCRISEWFAGALNVSGRRTTLPSEGRAKRLVRGLRYWPSAFARESFDIFECMHMPLVKAPTGKTLLTVHDMRSLHGIDGRLAQLASRLISSRSMKSADHVITVSDSMRREIKGFYPEAEISVIHNGLDAGSFAPRSPEELAETRLKFELPAQFLLAVGHMEPRKNYLRLIEALSILRARGLDFGLVIVGNDSGEKDRVQSKINANGLDDRVRILGGLSEAQVRCIYQLCSLFVFPSLYEGFGIPLLEAMAAGKPMVISDIPVFREITQDQGMYFDQNSSDSIAGRIESTLGSPGDRERLIAYGARRVQDFQFAALAGQVERIYRRLVFARDDRSP